MPTAAARAENARTFRGKNLKQLLHARAGALWLHPAHHASATARYCSRACILAWFMPFIS